MAQPQLIRQRELVTDEWLYLSDGAVLPGDPTSELPALIVPLPRWMAEREHWRQWRGRLGVRIAPPDRIERLAPDLDRLSLVAIEFTAPSEGRGYSQARVLRDRYRFGGELRAVGYVKRDQLFFLARCGFDAFELSEGVDPAQAAAAFDDFTVAYQPASERYASLRRRT
jgi:uncharacterized protein (DUF934 family)